MDDLERRPEGNRKRRRPVRPGEAIRGERGLPSPGGRERGIPLALEPALRDPG
jgi:hypothetical protein